MLTKEEFAAQCERGAATLSQAPVTRSILYYLVDKIKEGEPDWWKKTAKAWEKRKFFAWSEPWTLFVTCLHFEALGDEDHPLTSYFPSCGGTAEADISTALGKYLAEAPESFFTNLKSVRRRYYNKALAGTWRMLADSYFGELDVPYYLVEVDAGAGLNLAADIIQKDKSNFDSDLIQARVGLDPSPLIVQDLVHRRWLAAAVFPDYGPLISGIGEDVEKLADLQRRDTNFVQLVKCEMPVAPKFIAKNIPADPDCGLLVMNIMSSGKLTDPEYAEYTEEMTKMMQAWGDRAVWFEAETVRAEHYSTTILYTASRILNGTLQRIQFGWVDYATNQLNISLTTLKKALGTENPDKV